MAIQDKFIGIILVVLGALPFLLKIEKINGIVGNYTWILPGEYVYQIAIIILGLLLLIQVKPKVHVERRR